MDPIAMNPIDNEAETGLETVENENANIGLASAAANLPDAPQMGSSTTTVVTKRGRPKKVDAEEVDKVSQSNDGAATKAKGKHKTSSWNAYQAHSETDGMDKAEVAAAYQLVRKHRKEWLQSITEQYEKTAEAQNKKKGRLYKSIEEDYCALEEMNEEYLRFEFKMGKDGYTSEPCLSEAVEAILRDKHPNLWEAMKLIGFEIACALNSENRSLKVLNSVEEKVDLKQSRKKREISQKFQSLFDELKKKHSEFPISSMWYSDMSLLNIMANGLPPGVELKRIEGYSKDNIDEIYECLDDVTFAKKPLPTEDPPTASRTVDRRTPNQIAAESVDMISRLPAVFANPAAFANPVAFTNVNYAAMVGAVVDPANITGWRQTSLEQIHANIFVQQDQDFEGQADENDPSAASVNVLEPTAGVAAAPAPSNKRKKTRSRR